MHTSGTPRLLATLWQLGWDQERVSCVVYRTQSGMQLRIESAAAVMFSEQFDCQPRTLARAQALRAALKRRGWKDV